MGPLAPMPPLSTYAPAPAKTPVLGIVAVILAVLLAPVGLVLGIITLALAKGRTAAKVLGIVAVVVSSLICAGLAALIIWAVSSISGAQHVADEFVGDLQRGDVPAAYALTSPKFQAAVPESAFQARVTSGRAVFSSPHHRVSSNVSTSTNIGTYTDIVYAFDASPHAYLEVQLVKENGSWRVIYIDEKGTP
ncbi:hypothetical protein Back2_02260 [Nocardioides baekrokdamisoli]|uniref:DUF4190 domain-containing protein n=1 Tax=Nocardioides baekrokdamisoli TaxID=1804624 RepID=A0A3G9IZ07_9ACTN|nr:hypothetical protein Back2_02260 [Nocardioides baekrokdamisoli]